MVVVVLACVVGSLGQPFPWQQSVNNITASDKCGGLGSCADCVKTSLGCSWCGSLGRCLSPGDQTNCPEAPYAGSMLGCAALPTSPDDARCRALPICGNCVRSTGCGWCPVSRMCMADTAPHAGACAQGFSNRSCFETCGDTSPIHEAQGEIHLGSQGIGSPAQYPVYYLPHETCVYTIATPPEGSTSRRMTIIRLQFEYVDLAPGDYVELFANGFEGQLLMKITSANAALMVNKVITSRSNSVSLRFVSVSDQYATGFKATYKVIQGSPLDVYLISAIVTVSILSCILCSCCCNNWLSVIVGQSSRLAGSNGPPRLLSMEEKNRIPTTPYCHPESGKMDVTECCICLADFEVGETVRKLPCSHLFHPGCIDTWLEFNTLCPLCKQDVRAIGGEDRASGACQHGFIRRCLCCGARTNSVNATTNTEGTGQVVELVELEAGTLEEHRRAMNFGEEVKDADR